MTDYLPVAADIEPELAELALGDDLDAISEKLGIAGQKLQRLITNDPEAVDMIKAARAEYATFLRLKAELMGEEALETLHRAMNEELDAKKATAAVRAAESTLDRTLLPKITRQTQEGRADDTKRALPDLTELVEGAEGDEEAHRITDQYLELLRKVDALRRGAKEVIDGSATEI